MSLSHKVLAHTLATHPFGIAFVSASAELNNVVACVMLGVSVFSNLQ